MEAEMTFLKKLGSALASVMSIALGVGPLVMPFLGSGKAASVAGIVANDFTAIGQTVLTIEAAFQAPGTGTQKLSAAVPLIAGIVKTSQMLDGKKIANETLFTQGCEQITNGMVDILNSIHPDEAKVSPAV
jgi:hypothetical protein